MYTYPLYFQWYSTIQCYRLLAQCIALCGEPEQGFLELYIIAGLEYAMECTQCYLTYMHVHMLVARSHYHLWQGYYIVSLSVYVWYYSAPDSILIVLGLLSLCSFCSAASAAWHTLGSVFATLYSSPFVCGSFMAHFKNLSTTLETSLWEHHGLQWWYWCETPEKYPGIFKHNANYCYSLKLAPITCSSLCVCVCHFWVVYLYHSISVQCYMWWTLVCCSRFALRNLASTTLWLMSLTMP